MSKQILEPSFHKLFYTDNGIAVCLDLGNGNGVGRSRQDTAQIMDSHGIQSNHIQRLTRRQLFEAVGIFNNAKGSMVSLKSMTSI